MMLACQSHSDVSFYQMSFVDKHSSWAFVIYRFYLFSLLIASNSKKVDGLGDVRAPLHKMSIISCKAPKTLKLLSLRGLSR